MFLKLQPFLDFENKKLDGDHQMSLEQSCRYKLTKGCTIYEQENTVAITLDG